MAKYDVTYKCGHEDRIQLYGKESERQSRIAWLQKNLCPKCYKESMNNKRQAENEKAKELSVKNSHLELTGTEKQVAWATTIREEIMELLEKMINKDTERGANFMAYVASKTNAGYWIDNRDAKLDIKGYVFRTAKEAGLDK